MSNVRAVRRMVISLVLAATVAATSAGCATTSDGGESGQGVLIVEGYGAEYQPIFEKVIAKPFTAETGIQVKFSASESASAQYAKIRASNGDPGFDVTVMTNLELYQGSRDKLLAPVSTKQVPNLSKLAPKLRANTYGVGIIQDVQQLVLMYNKSRFTQPPTSWGAMWDPKYRSGALIYNPLNVIGVYQMLLAAEMNGGGIDDTEPGFAQLKQLAKYALATPAASAEAVQYMTKGTATLFPYLDGRAAIYARTTNFDYTVPQEGSYASLGTVGIPKEAEHKDAAYKFMNFWLSEKVQQKWARAYNVGPAVTGLTFPASFTGKHVTSAAQLDKLKIADAGTVVKNRTAWQQQWAQAVR